MAGWEVNNKLRNYIILDLSFVVAKMFIAMFLKKVDRNICL